MNIIGTEKFLKLKEIEKEIVLDYTQFGFIEKCRKLNEILAAEFVFFKDFTKGGINFGTSSHKN